MVLFVYGRLLFALSLSILLLSLLSLQDPRIRWVFPCSSCVSSPFYVTKKEKRKRWKEEERKGKERTKGEEKNPKKKESGIHWTWFFVEIFQREHCPVSFDEWRVYPELIFPPWAMERSCDSLADYWFWFLIFLADLTGRWCSLSGLALPSLFTPRFYVEREMKRLFVSGSSLWFNIFGCFIHSVDWLRVGFITLATFAYYNRPSLIYFFHDFVCQQFLYSPHSSCLIYQTHAFCVVASFRQWLLCLLCALCLFLCVFPSANSSSFLWSLFYKAITARECWICFLSVHWYTPLATNSFFFFFLQNLFYLKYRLKF